MTRKSPVGDISVVTLIRTDTTLDHSQEAEKVWQLHTRNNMIKPKCCCQLLVLLFFFGGGLHVCWAEAPIKIARMTLTIKLDGIWNSFQLANNTPPLSVTGSVIAPSARITSTGVNVMSSAHLRSRNKLKRRATRMHNPRLTARIMFVTPKGALRLAMCKASATR